MIPAVSALRYGAQHGLRRSLHTATQQTAVSQAAVVQGIHQGGVQQQQQQQQQTMKENMQFQASLAARAQQMNITISELQPKSAALKDPQARKEVELRLKDLARQGLFISEASRDLDAILLERGRAW